MLYAQVIAAAGWSVFYVTSQSVPLLQTAETTVRTTLQKEKDEQEAKYNLQLTTLNENLGTLRIDYSAAQTKLEELERTVQDLRGEKLGK